MTRIPRPHWLPIEMERTIRRTLTEVGKLQAVKDLKEFSKEHVSHDYIDENGKVNTYRGIGLKESKDYVDQLDKLGPDPYDELDHVVRQIENLQEERRILIEECFDYLTPENKEKAMTDMDYLKGLLRTSNLGNKFGI